MMENTNFTQPNYKAKRELEIDIARGLAVFFMVFVHLLLNVSTDKIIESKFGLIIDFLGGIPSAPVFMLLLGVGVVYSRNQSFSSNLYRGIKVLIIAYSLNLLRETIPKLLYYFNSEGSINDILNSYFNIDILQFAGLTLIFFAFVKKFSFHHKLLIKIGVIIGFINFLLLNINCDNIYLSSFQGLFWGVNSISEFPFFSWIIYPITGYIFGYYLISCSSKKQLYKEIIKISLPTMILLLGVSNKLELNLSLETEIEYYHHDLFSGIFFLSVIFTWISMLFFISRNIPSILQNILYKFSKNVTSIYVHWVIVGWLVYFDVLIENIFVFIMTSILILAFSNFLSKYLNPLLK
jgi:uncharacterized membrane protein